MCAVCDKQRAKPIEDYLKWFDDAEKRTKRGEIQSQCTECKKWFWPKK